MWGVMGIHFLDPKLNNVSCLFIVVVPSSSVGYAENNTLNLTGLQPFQRQTHFLLDIMVLDIFED